MAKKKKYIPSSKHNPAKQSLRLDKLETLIENLDKTIKAQSTVHDNHISYLANFARHDIKNSIQSMDSVLSTNTAEEITEDNLESLKTNLKVIRDTMENFSKLVPYSQDEKFSLSSLISAIELLNRATLFEKQINFTKEFPKDDEIRFSLPFQSVLQMMNNLVINSIKSLEGIENPEIKLIVKLDDNLTIAVTDNGKSIETGKEDRVFDFGYSTTGGSGIGLFHARYLCTQFGGTIELNITPEATFKKTFLITLPITIDPSIE